MLNVKCSRRELGGAGVGLSPGSGGGRKRPAASGSETAVGAEVNRNWGGGGESCDIVVKTKNVAFATITAIRRTPLFPVRYFVYL